MGRRGRERRTPDRRRRHPRPRGDRREHPRAQPLGVGAGRKLRRSQEREPRRQYRLHLRRERISAEKRLARRVRSGARLHRAAQQPTRDPLRRQGLRVRLRQRLVGHRELRPTERNPEPRPPARGACRAPRGRERDPGKLRLSLRTVRRRLLLLHHRRQPRHPARRNQQVRKQGRSELSSHEWGHLRHRTPLHRPRQPGLEGGQGGVRLLGERRRADQGGPRLRRAGERLLPRRGGVGRHLRARGDHQGGDCGRKVQSRQSAVDASRPRESHREEQSPRGVGLRLKAPRCALRARGNRSGGGQSRDGMDRGGSRSST